MAKPWSTPEDIRTKVNRLWERGDILRESLHPEGLFPLTIPLKGPTSAQISAQLGDVITWADTLRRGRGYTLQEKETNYRLVGRNLLPTHACIHSLEDAVALLGRKKDLALFRENAQALLSHWPQLEGWMLQYPKVLVDGIGTQCSQYIAVLQWFLNHPQPNLYLRQLDIPGVDTKFIEHHQKHVEKLLLELLPSEQVNLEEEGFEGKFLLKTKPITVRLRILDHQLYQGTFSDLTVPLEELARWAPPFKRIFITENLVNFLAFPPVPNSIILFGSGKNIARFGQIPWLAGKDIYYWGDIDTHGFHILGRLRGRLPQTQSILMDEATLLAHKPLWVDEESQHMGTFSNLTPEEQNLATALQKNILGQRVRMEQERIAFGYVEQSIEQLLDEADRSAESADVRATSDEVFHRVRDRIAYCKG